MSEEEKKALENKRGENPTKNQGNEGEDQATKIARLEKENSEFKENNETLSTDLEQSRKDVSNYQGEADRAKSKLDDKEQLDVREEGLAEREHKANISDIERDYPDVFKSYPDAFDSLKGSEKNEYINQAKYLQQGLDKVKASPAENKPAENAGDNNQPVNKNGAPSLPASGQNNNSTHIFTRAELAEHKGDQKWFDANEAEIDKQVAEGLVL